jgi:large-conductance mechanosensitive channel
MTPSQYKDWYYKNLEQYEKTSFEILKKGFKNVLKKLDKATSTKEIETLIKKDDIFEVILALYVIIGTAQANKILKGINNNTLDIKAINPLFGEAFAQAVLKYLEEYGGDKIISIYKTFIKAVIDFIMAKNEEGAPFVRTVKELQDNFGEETGLYRWQMMRIVRTETASASNYASWKAMESERLIIDKVWISAHDSRVRDGEDKGEYDHAEMDEMTLPRETLFKVPNEDGSFDELMYPVDPNGHPSNTINCRCTIAPKPRRDKDGRLIFKPFNQKNDTKNENKK